VLINVYYLFIMFVMIADRLIWPVVKFNYLNFFILFKPQRPLTPVIAQFLNISTYLYL
jgi:hypothetical protein